MRELLQIKTFSPLAVLLVLVLGGCGGGFEFPVITTEDQIAELSFQRERALGALGQTVDSLHEGKASLDTVNSQNAQAARDLEKERGNVQEALSKISALALHLKGLEEQLENSRKELVKFKETRSKIEEMAQGTLGELSELRQKNEGLQGEKSRLEKEAAAQDKHVETLSREADDLKAELTKIRIAFRALQDDGDGPGRKPGAPGDELAGFPEIPADMVQERIRLEKQASVQSQHIETLTRQATQFREELIKRGFTAPEVEVLKIPEFVAAAPVETKAPGAAAASAAADKEAALRADAPLMGLFQALVARVKKAFHGEIAWDAFDITVVSVISIAIIGPLLLVFFFKRSRALSRRLTEVQNQYASSLSQQSQSQAIAGSQTQIIEEEAEEVDEDSRDDGSQNEIAQAIDVLEDKSRAAKSRAAIRSPTPAPTQSQSVSQSQPSFRARRPGVPAENFSTIIRKKEEAKEEAAPAPARKPAEEAPAKSTDAKSPRRIIGAVRDEGSLQETKQLERTFLVPTGKSTSKPAFEPQSSAGGEEDEGGHTQIIGEFDDDLFRQKIPKAGAGKSADNEKTAPLGVSKPPSKAAPKANAGSSDEQELLKELKSIISKKFDQVK